MKRIKISQNDKVRRSLSLSSDSDSSVSSFHSNDSTKSYGKWCKRADLGPVIRCQPMNRDAAPVVKIKPIQRPDLDEVEVVGVSSTPNQHDEVLVAPVAAVAAVARKKIHFDLTDEHKEHTLLPGVSFKALKIRHELFFTYDPRGSKIADDRYCPACKCPKGYCNETVFGEVVKNQTLFFIEEIGGVKNEGVQGDSTFYNYQKIYSEEIHHKMLTNGIKVPTGYNFHKLISIPECVFQGSLKQLIKKCQETKYMKFELGDPWVLQERKRKSKGR